MINVTRRTAVVGLSTLIASPVCARTPSKSRPKPDGVEFVVLAQSAVLEITPRSGSLKETVQCRQCRNRGIQRAKFSWAESSALRLIESLSC